jgi:hypothetical protein
VNSASTAPTVTTAKNTVANPGRSGDAEFPVCDGVALARIGIHTGGGANNSNGGATNASGGPSIASVRANNRNNPTIGGSVVGDAAIASALVAKANTAAVRRDRKEERLRRAQEATERTTAKTDLLHWQITLNLSGNRPLHCSGLCTCSVELLRSQTTDFPNSRQQVR